MTVGIIGSGPAVVTVQAALVDADTTRIDVDALGTTELAVVIGTAGDPVFAEANERALETETPWIAVELGGLGGIAVADASVSCFEPGAGCYECLSGRVTANLDRQPDPRTPETATGRFAGAIAGREAASALAGESIGGQVITLPYEQRRLLPLPNCVCDPGDRGELDRSDGARDVEAALARAEQSLDDTIGIVQEVGEVESFPVPYYLAQSCETAGFSDASASREAAGVDPDWNAAFMKALGEGLERYCAGVYRGERLEHGAPESVEGAVPPSAFVCEHEPDPAEPIEWVPGEELAGGDRRLLPAEFVYHPPPEHRYHPPVTTGLGLGNSTVEALLSGLYEVIERDAMMLAWHSSFEPLGLAVEDETYETMVRRADSEGYAVQTLLLTQDVDVPVVATAVTGDEWPELAFGTAADLDVTAAAESALAEALQNWTELRGMGPEEAADAMGAIGRYASDPGPAAAFVDPETTVPASSVGPDSVPDGEAELDNVLDKLDDAGLDAYGARLTTRDVDQLGFEAVRAVVPAAQPLTFGESYFGERATTVPGQMGFEARLDAEHHPFP
ncbi:bacteriocin biosynthesis protein SagD [Halovenus sp. WSH3]|uniref:Bacteriocin biosynthesis protein SagD n=1 Tax=Halovenus carboxidivorans TaxID=2692199 RepID=A0A6B0SZ07_9EURY|nr:YcaO-like family protein [Halovenus carboxidivorans]MXR51028.1 bacteriocin biosynthesis protein SagD [Halovenus carboxidivorans]